MSDSPFHHLPADPPTISIPPQTKKRYPITSLFLITLIPTSLTVFFYIFIYLSPPPSLISPIGAINNVLGITSHKQKSDHIILGFLPYWEFKDKESIRYDLLTHLAIFAVSFDSQGDIVTREEDYGEPGWTALNSTAFTHVRRQARAAGTKVILVIKAFDPDTIDSIIGSDVSTQTLINHTLELIDSKNFDGINIDFEYVPQASETSATNFTHFTQQLTTAIKNKNPSLHVSLDIFGDSYDNHRIWQIQPLANIVDHIVVMAYDYHRPSSTNSGPVAPLYGAGANWDTDITSAFSKFTSQAPSDQFILGVPYYGYEWTTTSHQHLAPTVKRSGGTATYKRVQDLIHEENPQVNWDPIALSPWLTYLDSGDTQQIYYEDTRSLGLKYDFTRQAGLGGIAIWALGYDTGYSHLWELIQDKFYPQPQASPL